MRISYYFSQGASAIDYIKKANESYQKLKVKVNNFNKLQIALSLYDYQKRIENSQYFYFKDNYIMLHKN